MAWGCFTILPCPYKKWDENARNHMLFSLPFIGLIIGIIWWALCYLLHAKMGLPVALTGAVLAITPSALSGFIHVDGYMDCCDAIGSRRPMEDKQRILKDSHVGAFACIGLAALALLSYGAMQAVLEEQSMQTLSLLIVIPMLSRFMSAIAVWDNQALQVSEYHASSHAKETRALSWALTIIVILLVVAYYLIFDFVNILKLVTLYDIVLGVEIIVHFISCKLAIRELGGMNGDISGFAITVSEATAIFTLALI